eukprot:COSAG01_NODE_3928_length_5526_cov_8.623803_5_plen_132_part_00
MSLRPRQQGSAAASVLTLLTPPPPAPGAPQAVQESKDASVEQAREKAKRQIAEAQLATREAASATAEAAAEAAYPSRPPHRNAPLGLSSGGSSTSTPGGAWGGIATPDTDPAAASRPGEPAAAAIRGLARW